MIDSNFIKNSELSLQNVSRETLDDLNKYGLSIIKKNKEINLISTSTEKSINSRHIADSAQTIDFINKNDIKICTDLGSGAGLPGIVLAIMNTEVNQKNIFEQKDLRTDIIISRAFKPLPIIFEIALNNFKKFKYIILFLGKSGKEILNEASKKWKFKYEEKKSLTSDESLIVKISNLQKKNG